MADAQLRAAAAFTNAGNLVDAAAYMDKALQNEGFNNPELSSLSCTDGQKTTIINVMYQVLHRYKQVKDGRDSLEDGLHRANNDISQLRAKNARLDADFRQTDRNSVVQEEAQRQLNLKLQKVQDQLKKSKELTKAAKAEKAHLATQYDHFRKRQEKDTVKLKEKLQKLLNDKNSERKLGMRVLNSLQRKDGARGTWAKTGRADEELHRVIITNYEDRQKELMLENSELRESLATMETELIGLLNGSSAAAAVDVTTTLDDTHVTSESDTGDGPFALPYALSREGIEDSLKTKLANLKEKFLELQISATAQTGGDGDATAADPTSAHDHEKIDDLQRQLDECARIIERQQQALLDSVTAGGAIEDTPDKSFLSDSVLQGKEDSLRREQEDFDRRVREFEAERGRFTEAAHQLDLDRARLRVDRLCGRSTPSGRTPGATVGTPRPAHVTPSLSRLLMSVERFTSSSTPGRDGASMTTTTTATPQAAAASVLHPLSVGTPAPAAEQHEKHSTTVPPVSSTAPLYVSGHSHTKDVDLSRYLQFG